MANRSSRSFKLAVGAALMALTAIGGVFASAVTGINSGEKVEFGQGYYKVKACDSWIRMNFTTGSVEGGDAGMSPLTGITIDSLDTTACANTQITITVLDNTDSESPLPLYQTQDPPSGVCTISPCSEIAGAAKSVTLLINNSGLVSLDPNDLVDPTGQFHTLITKVNRGQFEITFTQPAALAALVGRLTIQSGISSS